MYSNTKQYDNKIISNNLTHGIVVNFDLKFDFIHIIGIHILNIIKDTNKIIKINNKLDSFVYHSFAI